MKLALAFLGALVVAAPVRAGTKPWTVDDVLAVKTVTDPQVSPDGQWVAYVVSSLNEEKDAYQTDVWLVGAAGGEARALTSASGDDENPRWSPDGKWIAFISDRPRPGTKKDKDDEDGKRQVWLLRPDGGEPTVLTSSGGNVTDLRWAPDGKTIGYLARDPKSEERKKKEKDKDDAWTPSEMYPWVRLWTIDVGTKAARQVTRGELHVADLAFSPDGKRIAFSGQPTPLIPDQWQADIYVIDTAGGEPRRIVERKGIDQTPSWSPDGKWIAFLSQDGADTEWFTNNYLCVVSPEGGQVRNLTKSLDERIGALGGSGIAWSPDSASVVFPSLQKTAGQIFRASLDGRVSPLTKGPELDTAPALDRKGQTLVYLREDSTNPREVYRQTLPAGPPKALTDTNPQVRDLLAFPKERLTWKGAGGWEIEGLLVTPPGYKAGTRVPLLLNVHGGPAGTHSNTFSAASRLYAWPLYAQAGYAVFFPNPRGSGGYGEKFRAANVRDWGGGDYEDIMAGVDALVERGVADKDRLAVCGWSYGGFMTSTIVTKTDRFKAAVVGAGVTHLSSFTGTTDIPDFARSYFASWPWEDPEEYAKRSAVLHLGKVKTPTLVVHGDKDDRVPVSQGWELYMGLKKAGVPTDLLILPRQPHGPREPKLLKTCVKWHREWIDKYTLGTSAATAAGAGVSVP
jgi:dipeptidyl aminopeptidase/acylaminoacyl peptidase